MKTPKNPAFFAGSVDIFSTGQKRGRQVQSIAPNHYIISELVFMAFHTCHTRKQNYSRNTSHNFVDALSPFYGEINLNFQKGIRYSIIPHLLSCRLSEASAHVVVLELEPER